MSKSSMRIVLVDPLGDVLFSGDSLISQVIPECIAACPETQRSAQTHSGIYPKARVEQAEQDDVETVRQPKVA